MTGEQIRLSKLMAQLGLCSRREADEYIAQGLVLVDGRPVRELGTKVFETQVVSLLPAAEKAQAARVTILLNKPVGFVSGQPEDDYQPAVSLITVANHVPQDRQTFRKDHLKGLAPAGRLDIDSRGLLVFTQDGRLARLLTGEDSQVEKEYFVRIEGEVTSEKLARLHHGLELDGKPLKPAHVSLTGPGRLKMVLREGRHRQIRRMCAAVDLRVTSLIRLRIGKIQLGQLPEGQWRYLGPNEKFA